MAYTLAHHGYSAGHPWYYHWGGAVPSPKVIRDEARATGYSGYREAEILAAATLPEPQRSHRLAAIRCEVLEDLRGDISRYRAIARTLQAQRRSKTETTRTAGCPDNCTSLSLKYAHIFNGFAHLELLDAQSRQGDLFG